MVVAQRLGYDSEVALTLGKAVAGLNAQSKGRRLGIFEESTDKEERAPKALQPGAQPTVTVLGRSVLTLQTNEGMRATVKGQPIDPQSVRRYLEKKFGEDLADVQAAMEALANAYSPSQLVTQGYALYEKFRPQIPEGTQGWGAAGELNLDQIRLIFLGLLPGQAFHHAGIIRQPFLALTQRVPLRRLRAPRPQSRTRPMRPA